MTGLSVLQPGVLTTVQDLGRCGHSQLGVAAAGALDALSLRVGNRLVGNDEDAAALELTLLGGTLRCDGDVVVALTGAPMTATIEDRDGARQSLPRAAAVPVRAGGTLRIGGCAWGARAYLCVQGGIDVPAALGSRATHVASGLGGHQGRALRAGDRLAVGNGPARRALAALGSDIVAGLDAILRQPTLRATDGAHARTFADAARAAFWGGTFTVSERCDRAGVRLRCAQVTPPAAGMLTSEGMPRGAVEIASHDEAIILLADGPPTGGYPAIATIASVDHARLGQLRPRETVAFLRVSLEEARALHTAREAWLAAAVAL